MGGHVAELLTDLRAAGIELWSDGGMLRYRALKGVLTAERLEQIRGLKAEIVAALASTPSSQTTDEPTLERTGDEDDMPLSFTQEYFYDQYPRLTVPEIIHPACAFSLRGHLDLPALKRAARELLVRHSVLRTRFTRLGADVRASVDPSIHEDIGILDLTDVNPADRDVRARDHYLKVLREPFRLEEARPVRIGVVTCAPGEHVLFVVLHHIVCDAWSLRLLLRELVMLYDALVAGTPAPLPALPLRYCDFARWERRVERDLGGVLLEHWRARFDGLAEDPFSLPADTNPARDLPDEAQRLFAGTVSGDTVEGLRALARRTQSTVFCVVAAVVCVLLRQWSGRDDGLVVVVRNGRDHRELDDLVGLYSPTWGLRMQLGGCRTFESVVRRVWQTYCEDTPFMQLPYYRLARLLASGTAPLPPQIIFNYWAGDGPSSPLRMDVAASPVMRSARVLDWTPAHPWIDERNMRFYVIFFEQPHSLGWEIKYARRVFSDSTIAGVSRRLHELLESVATSPHGAIT
jgi:hypothetical protein